MCGSSKAALNKGFYYANCPVMHVDVEDEKTLFRDHTGKAYSQVSTNESIIFWHVLAT